MALSPGIPTMEERVTSSTTAPDAARVTELMLWAAALLVGSLLGEITQLRQPWLPYVRDNIALLPILIAIADRARRIPPGVAWRVVGTVSLVIGAVGFVWIYSLAS